MGFVDLWKWDGKVGRRSYALAGLIGFAIKHNIDRTIAASYIKTRSYLINTFKRLIR
jgi:hypothetical protein